MNSNNNINIMLLSDVIEVIKGDCQYEYSYEGEQPIIKFQLKHESEVRKIIEQI